MSKIYYWPTLANEVWVDCNACPACMVAKPSKMLGKALVPEAKMSEILPMEEVSIDFFHTSKGEMLAFVDRASGYKKKFDMRNMSTDLLISTLEKWFKTVGYPHRIRSDGGPAFRDKWERWAKSKGIEPQITSPYSSSSNGLAEHGVKEIKRLWMKCELDNSDFDEAMFVQNNTTRLNGG